MPGKPGKPMPSRVPPDDPMPGDAWDQWPGEPDYWFDIFDRLYRPQGVTRSFQGTYRLWRAEQGKTPATGRNGASPDTWARAREMWQWQRRAGQWDVAQRAERLRVEEEARAEMLRSHQTVYRSMLAKGFRALQRLDEAELSPSEVRQWIMAATTGERQARGLPAELVAIAGMTDEELLERYSQVTDAMRREVENTPEES